MRRFGTFAASDDVLTKGAALRRVIHADLFAERFDEILRGQLRQIDFDEIRITEVLRAVVKTDTHGFGQQMDRLGVTPLHLTEIVSFENVQDLNNRRSAGAGRRHPDYVVTAIRATKRRSNLCIVAGQIVHRDDPAAGLNARHQTFRNFTLVESVGSVAGNLLQSPGEFGKLHGFAGFVKRAVGFAIDTAEFVKLRHHAFLALQRPRQHIVDNKPVARELQSRFDDGLPIELSITPGCLIEAAHCSRNANSQFADIRLFLVDLAVREEHGRCGFLGSLFTKIDAAHLPAFVREVDQHETTAAEVAGSRMSDGQREACRDCGVDGIAALFQNLHAGSRCDRLHGHDGAVFKTDRSIGRLHRSRSLREAQRGDHQQRHNDFKLHFCGFHGGDYTRITSDQL